MSAKNLLIRSIKLLEVAVLPQSLPQNTVKTSTFASSGPLRYVSRASIGAGCGWPSKRSCPSRRRRLSSSIEYAGLGWWSGTMRTYSSAANFFCSAGAARADLGVIGFLRIQTRRDWALRVHQLNGADAGRPIDVIPTGDVPGQKRHSGHRFTVASWNLVGPC